MDIKESADKTIKEKLPPVDRSGINTRAVLMFCAILIVTAIIVHIAVLYLFKAFDNNQKEKDPVLSPLTPKQQQLPPEPRLQAAPNTLDINKQLFDSRNVEALKQDAEQKLNSYGWVDDKNGIVRIPITDAMKMIVEKVKQTQTAPTQTNKSSSHVQQ
jgi:hypothetical protein